MNRRTQQKFGRELLTRTPLLQMSLLLTLLWLLFSAGVYFTERDIDGTTITSYGRALYWGVAAFSTAGIADMPLGGLSEFIGGVWIVIGSILFFGTIVATVTAYFMRPLQRPLRQIIEIVEYNLEQLEDLSVDELEVLKETVAGLIEHMEQVKDRKLRIRTERSPQGWADLRKAH